MIKRLAAPLKTSLKAALCLSLFSSLTLPATAQAQNSAPRIAVLELQSKGQANSLSAGMLSDRIRSMVVQSQSFQVMERESMDKILKEQGFQSSQNCEDESCSIQMGRLLSVKQILTGSLNKMGNLYVLNLRIVNTETGAILKEEYIDCSCNIETLMQEKLRPLVASLIDAEALPVRQTTATNQPVRVSRPWLLSLSGGNINHLNLDMQFNFNEYFAVHGSGGTGFVMDFMNGYSGFGNSIFGQGGVKAYFNPHDLAGFADLVYNSNSWVNALLGLEYRHPQGLTFTVSTGLGFEIRATQPHLFTAAGFGYAF